MVVMIVMLYYSAISCDPRIVILSTEPYWIPFQINVSPTVTKTHVFDYSGNHHVNRSTFNYELVLAKTPRLIGVFKPGRDGLALCSCQKEGKSLSDGHIPR